MAGGAGAMVYQSGNLAARLIYTPPNHLDLRDPMLIGPSITSLETFFKNRGCDEYRVTRCA